MPLQLELRHLFNLALADPVHAAVGLEHERLEDLFVLDRLAGQDRVDELLGRDLVQPQVPCQPVHAGPELDLGVEAVLEAPGLDLVLGPLEHGLELVDLGDLKCLNVLN